MVHHRDHLVHAFVTETVHSIAVSTDGKLVAVGTSVGDIHILRVDNFSKPGRKHRISAARVPVITLTFGDRYLYACALNGNRLTLDYEDNKVVDVNLFEGHVTTPTRWAQYNLSEVLLATVNALGSIEISYSDSMTTTTNALSKKAFGHSRAFFAGDHQVVAQQSPNALTIWNFESDDVEREDGEVFDVFTFPKRIDSFAVSRSGPEGEKGELRNKIVILWHDNQLETVFVDSILSA
jgi:hypothetical protein